MVTVDQINGGMTFEELLSTGSEDPSTYSGVLSPVVDQVTFALTPGNPSEFNLLFGQLGPAETVEEQQRVANALCDLLNAYKTSIETVITDDLARQEAIRQDNSNLNIAASLLPSENVQGTQIFEAIATPAFKQILDEGLS